MALADVGPGEARVDARACAALARKREKVMPPKQYGPTCTGADLRLPVRPPNEKTRQDTRLIWHMVSRSRMTLISGQSLAHIGTRMQVAPYPRNRSRHRVGA